MNYFIRHWVRVSSSIGLIAVVGALHTNSCHNLGNNDSQSTSNDIPYVNPKDSDRFFEFRVPGEDIQEDSFKKMYDDYMRDLERKKAIEELLKRVKLV